jgi:hypothetical protein
VSLGVVFGDAGGIGLPVNLSDQALGFPGLPFGVIGGNMSAFHLPVLSAKIQ